MKTRALGGLITIAGTILFVSIVLALHFIQVDYDPVHQLISELVLGLYGNIMLLAFLGLGACSLGLQISLIGTKKSLLLQLLLTNVTICFAGAGFYTLGNALTIHIVLIAVAFVLIGLVMYLFPYHSETQTKVISRPLSWGLALAMTISAILAQSILPMGIGQRLTTVFLLTWFVIVGWNFMRHELFHG